MGAIPFLLFGATPPGGRFYLKPERSAARRKKKKKKRRDLTMYTLSILEGEGEGRGGGRAGGWMSYGICASLR